MKSYNFHIFSFFLGMILLFLCACNKVSSTTGNTNGTNPSGGTDPIVQLYPDSQIVQIYDHYLAAKIQEVINKPYPFYYVDVKKIKSLHADSSNIKVLLGIEYCTGLDTLDLSYNPKISFYYNLQSLTNLHTLILERDTISNIDFLEKMPQLVNLDLAYDAVNNLSSLQGLIQLKTLNLFENGKFLGDWRINDLSPLQRMTQLEELNIQHNTITDISPLKGLTKLRKLDLSSGYNIISDITPLQYLTNLKSLNVYGKLASKADVSVLKGLTKLDSLYLGNYILDYAPLQTLSNLKLLDLGIAQGSISPIVNYLPLLQKLYIYWDYQTASIQSAFRANHPNCQFFPK